MNPDEQIPQNEVEVEAIMQEIRTHILESKASRTTSGDLIVPAGGERLPQAFYDHLYHAALVHDRLGVKLNVTPVRIPVFGRIIEWARTKVHQLVLFYVNQLAVQQTQYNYHILQAISLLAQEMEDDVPTSK
ncbi:MAG: hypothetical protein M9928_18670 [Anaerolineae bacterium]|nr:hypothetical protein [Anaerolineae bacterium]MCO5188894.1 hypothetical protein [Anaerolineae bacterium]MCO5193299.1 hypothetical protein [Anaerolineae bacterium]MCO5196144.1 hypothetical protein [Anaerolineae bacterium]MCO5207038.1 hypothetical protein [Anaerolineae bacterium]